MKTCVRVQEGHTRSAYTCLISLYVFLGLNYKQNAKEKTNAKEMKEDKLQQRTKGRNANLGK
jgi:hypothetical protein